MLRFILAITVSGCLIGTAGGKVRQNVVVVLDDSGSMGDGMRSDRRIRKIDAAKKALLEVLDSLPADARVGVYALNSRSTHGPWIIPLGPVDRSQQRQAINGIRAQGGTPLGAAMKEATDALLDLRAKQHYGEYRLLVVSDGEAQDEYLVNQYLPQILSRHVTVDVIGVSMVQSHSLATRVDRYRPADDVESLQQAIQESLAETPLDARDSDEAAEFELLAGLTDEFAIAAIEALTQTDNRPLGELRTESSDEIAVNMPPSPGPAPIPLGRDPSGSPRSGVSKIAIFGIILVLMVIVKSVVRAAVRRR